MQRIATETVDQPRSKDERDFIAIHKGQMTDQGHPVATDAQKSGGVKLRKKDKSRAADLDDGEDKIVNEGSYQSDLDDSKPIVASGVKGIKSKSFKKKFRNMAAFEKWADSDTADDFEVREIRNEGFNLAGNVICEMTDTQMKKREEIVKSMKSKQTELKDRYGDEWKSVMYATATKTAMKEGTEITKLIEANIKAGKMSLDDGAIVTVSSSEAEALTNLFDELTPANRDKMKNKMSHNQKSFKEILDFAKEAMQ